MLYHPYADYLLMQGKLAIPQACPVAAVSVMAAAISDVVTLFCTVPAIP